MTDAPQIETSRLLLRPWRPGDVNVLAAIYADPEVMRYIGDGTTRGLEETMGAVDVMNQLWLDRGFGQWAVEVKESGELIGRQGLKPLDKSAEIEIGYCFGRSAWGRGYATESAVATMRFGFEVAGLDRIVGITYPENVASQRVLEKCGLTYERIDHFYGIDVRYYGCNASQWQAASLGP